MKTTGQTGSILTLHVGYAVHNGDWNWNNIRSPFSRVYLVTKGRAVVRTEKEKISLTPGHMYIIPAFTTHQDICTGEFEHFYLHIFEDKRSEKSIFDEWEFPTEIDSDELCHTLFTRLCEINPSLRLRQSNPESYDSNPMFEEHLKRNRMREIPVQMETRGIVVQLISRFLSYAPRKASIRDKRIREIVVYIKEHLDEEIDVDRLASMSCLSKDHFIRLFKKHVGKTPIQYITALKIEQAEILLSTSNMSIKRIAMSLGYDDNSYFIRLFRNHIGMTPSAYRTKFLSSL